MKRFATASVIAMLAMTGAASADVTPQQVWDDLEAYMTTFGYTVTGTESMAGGTLTVTDVSMSIAIPEEDTSVQMMMDSLVFADQGDGSVVMTYPEVMPIKVDIEDGEGLITIDMSQSGMQTRISGEPGALVYDIAADSLAMTISELIIEGESFGPDTMRADVTMGPISGRYDVAATSTMRAVAQTLSMGDLSYDFFFQDPDRAENQLMFKGTMMALMTAGNTVVPEGADFSDPAKMLMNGLAGDAMISHSGGTTDFSFSERGDTTTGQFTSAGGSLGVAVSADAVSYSLSAKDQTFAMAGPEIPLPINGGFTDIGFEFGFPLRPGEGEADAKLNVLLGGLTVSDLLWNIFDPGQALPRDPATVQVNFDAKLIPLVNMLDEEAMMELGMSGGMPAELISLNMTDLLVKAAGGMITGGGAFTFDNTDLETFDGLPRPIGKIDLSVSGANGLIDTLVSMGLLPEQEAMGARMMMGMFTVPGADPDTATSTLEINEQGHILANGQRIQ